MSQVVKARQASRETFWLSQILFKAMVPNLSSSANWHSGGSNGGEGEDVFAHAPATCMNGASCTHLLLAQSSSQWATDQVQAAD